MNKFHRTVFVLTLGLVTGLAPGVRGAEPLVLSPGKGSFVYRQGGKVLPVWYDLPAGIGPATPIVFVMHGVGRNASTYRDDWVRYAEQNHFILLCPEFSKKEFPSDAGYNFGNTVDLQGRPLPREQWGFNMIEPVFDLVRRSLGNRTATYALYGHSAGSQFVHRFLYFVPHARVSHVVTANAGWYTLPDPTVDFPYGLKGAPVSLDDLKVALQRPLLVLLGTADTDLKSNSLRTTPEAEAQGPYRFARGHYFFDHGRAEAAKLGVPFGWHLETAPGIGHSDPGMAPFAIHWLLSAPSA